MCAVLPQGLCRDGSRFASMGVVLYLWYVAASEEIIFSWSPESPWQRTFWGDWASDESSWKLWSWTICIWAFGSGCSTWEWSYGESSYWQSLDLDSMSSCWKCAWSDEVIGHDVYDFYIDNLNIRANMAVINNRFMLHSRWYDEAGVAFSAVLQSSQLYE